MRGLFETCVLLLSVVGCTGKPAAVDDPQATRTDELPATQASRDSQEPTHQLALSGTLATLIPEYGVNVTSSLAITKILAVGPVKEFPVRLPTAKFGAAYIEFVNTRGQRAFSVLFDKPLFEGNRDVTLSLDKPRLQLSVHGERELEIYHRAWIGDGVMYSDMPCWNEKKKQLSVAGDPILTVARDKTPNQPFASRKMVGVCMGLGWVSFVRLPHDVKSGDTVIVTVIHDTGDLWGKLSTTIRHTVQE
jgi:hypothetical protein